MTADGIWERNLDVQVRLAAGKLALRLGHRPHTLAPALVWVWHRFDGVTPVEQICAEADPGQVDEVRETVAALVEGGYLAPAGPARPSP